MLRARHRKLLLSVPFAAFALGARKPGNAAPPLRVNGPTAVREPA